MNTSEEHWTRKWKRMKKHVKKTFLIVESVDQPVTVQEPATEPVTVPAPNNLEK
jgi:hypothetical protein